MTAFDDALEEYKAKHEYAGMSVGDVDLTSDGYWTPPPHDTCPTCNGARWTSNSGSHLKSVEHIAAKHGVSVRELRNHAQAWEMMRPKPVRQSYQSNDESIEPDPEPKLTVCNTTTLGWKTLSLSLDDNGDRILSSQNDDFLWKPFEVSHAKCGTNDACMKESCSCGFYFFWEPTPATEYDAKRQVVVRCRLGGVVLEHGLGCRAEYAVITGILYHNNEKFVALMSELYGVPVVDKEGEVFEWNRE